MIFEYNRVIREVMDGGKSKRELPYLEEYKTREFCCDELEEAYSDHHVSFGAYYDTMEDPKPIIEIYLGHAYFDDESSTRKIKFCPFCGEEIRFYQSGLFKETNKVVSKTVRETRPVRKRI
jgi:hypothetical protein